MHNQTQALIPEGLEAPRQERLRGGRPRSDPLLVVSIEIGLSMRSLDLSNHSNRPLWALAWQQDSALSLG